MTETGVTGPEEQDFILSSLSPSLVQKRLALGVVLFLAIAFVIIAGPLSTLQLPPINTFIPVYATAMIVIDSITAILLFAQFSILRSRALLVLSSGYLFNALIVIPWALTFPGVFAPSGLLGAGLQSTSWLYILWHAGFPTFVIAYALLKDGDPTKRLWQGSVRMAIISSIAITAAIVCAAAILATAGHDLLPGLMVDTVHLSALWPYAAGFVSLLIALAIVLLWVRRRTTLDLWLMAIMFAFAIEIGLISFPVAARYTVGWYGGRICGVVSGSLLLFVLLYEITTLYSRLQNARLHSELQRSEALLAEAQSISSTGSFCWHVASGEIDWSEQNYKIFEYDRTATPTLKSVLQRVHPDDLGLVQETIDRASCGGTGFDLEHRLLMPDGRVKHLHVLARALKTSSGIPDFVGAVTDVTERKQAEEEQARLGQRLRQAEKMEAMGTLAGGIAHDFNNILGAILGYGELAQNAAAEGSTVRRYLDNVMNAGGRGKALVERILTFSRSSVGKRGPVKVQAVIEETLELLAASLTGGVRLDKRLQAGDAAVVGDATQLHQVTMNLCTNALQAMQNGGVLEVALDRAKAGQERRLSHGNLAPGDYVRLCVSDTGSGIPPQVLDRMFDPFFTTKGTGGTGLGLSLVHAIVGDLGGAIDVRTTVGRGTIFRIWLPTAGEAALASVEVTAELPRGDGQMVMIVEDEKPLVELAEEILAELGYEPIGFNSSTVALDAFRAAPQRFDIILTDETMPEIIGTDLAREITQVRPDMPIVLMSGYAGAQLQARAYAVGIREILHKPLQRRDIAECFGRVLQSPPLS
jgi:PAS domain S-box-containing protein